MRYNERRRIKPRLASKKQVDFLKSLERQLGEELVAEIVNDLDLDGDFDHMLVHEASMLIDELLDAKKAREEMFRPVKPEPSKGYPWEGSGEGGSSTEEMEEVLKRIKKKLGE